MNTIIQSIAIIISLLTATGVFVHEAHVDRVTAATANARKAAKNPKAPQTDIKLGAEPHTHPDHGAKTLRGFSYKNPTALPREQKMKKYLLQNVEPRGRHAFDNYNLPIVA